VVPLVVVLTGGVVFVSSGASSVQAESAPARHAAAKASAHGARFVPRMATL